MPTSTGSVCTYFKGVAYYKDIAFERPIDSFMSKPLGPVLQMHGKLMPVTWILRCTLNSP